MQQRPARTSTSANTRASRAAIAVVATLCAVPLAGRVAGGSHASVVSAGTVAATLAPALPARVLPDIERRGATARAHLDSLAPIDVPGLGSLSPRQRLAVGAPGTYIGELLRIRGDSVLRWPDRVQRPLTVWIATAASVPDWHPTYLARVTDAFTEWTRAGVPVRFRFVQDSSAAEVHVAWTNRFHEPISGRTVWTRDDHWWMTDANITLALHHNDGAPLDDDQVHAIALHEIGHLLGLDHTSDPTSVMAPRVRVRELSAADQATVRLVYALPPGHI